VRDSKAKPAVDDGRLNTLESQCLVAAAEYETVVIAFSFEGRGGPLVGHHLVMIGFLGIFGAKVVLGYVREDADFFRVDEAKVGPRMTTSTALKGRRTQAVVHGALQCDLELLSLV
jgi:hypothetical protein